VGVECKHLWPNVAARAALELERVDRTSEKHLAVAFLEFRGVEQLWITILASAKDD